MRRLVKGPVKARSGDVVRFHAKLRKDADQGLCLVFSSVGTAEPSPHVPNEKIGFLQKGRPLALSPTTFRLNRDTAISRTIEVVADENCFFYLFEDVDLANDKWVTGKAYRYGKLRQFTSAILETLRRISGRR